MQAVAHIDTLDIDNKQQWTRSIYYLYLLILHRRPTEEHEELKTLVHQQMKEPSRREEAEAMAQTMAEHLIEQGEKRGEKRGETRAKRETLLKLLHLQFDPVPESVITKITSIRSLSRLNALFEKVATAQTLDEIEWEDHEDRF